MALFDSYSAGDIGNADVHAARSEGQTFTPSLAYTITSVQLKLETDTADDEVMTVGIYATGDDGLPTGGALCSGAINANTLVASPGSWKEITLGAGADLIPGTVYAICCSCGGDTGAGTADVSWRVDPDDGAYAGGSRIYDNTPGGAWDDFVVGDDFMFKCYGDRISSGVPVDKHYSKRLVAIGNGEVWYESVENGTATGGTAITLLDSTRTEVDDYFIGWTLRIVAGTGIGETAAVTAYTEVGGIFGFAALSGGSTPDTTSRYTVDRISELAAASGEVDTTDKLNVTTAFQKVFIVNGSNKKVFDFVNIKIITANVVSGGEPPDFGTVLTSDGAGSPKMIVDYITRLTAGADCAIYGKRITDATFSSGDTITGTNPTTSRYAGAVSFDMTAADEVLPPHWYDYTVFGNNSDGLALYGAMPAKAYQICRYRGRIQLSGDPNYSHQWYQSRQLHPYDFLFAPGDAQSPVAGNDADCGEVGDIVKVAIPYSDDYLIYGCANELWVMSGDAAFGGELNPLDTTTGILGDRAWCWDDKTNLYIIGTAGLLRIPKGFGQIENLTRELWPDFIEDLAFDSSLHRIVLAFDPEKFGIHIFKTTLATGACSAWWYDLRVEGLFPDTIPTAMGIYSAFYYQTEDPSYKKLLVGCADGYVKTFDKSTKDDDSTKITSYVGFAPLALSTHPRKDGIIKNLDTVTGIGDTDSNNVTCTVHVARTAAQVIKKLNDGDVAAFTKVFVAPNWNKSNLDRRSIRGQWAAIVLTNNTAAQSWSMERLIIDSKEIGRSL